MKAKSSSIQISIALVLLVTSLFALSCVSFLYFYQQHQHLNFHGLINMKHDCLIGPFNSMASFINSTTQAIVAGVVEKEAEEEEEEEEEEDQVSDYGPLLPPQNAPSKERMEWFKGKLPQLRMLKSTPRTRKFDQRVRRFLAGQETTTTTPCKGSFFMTWIASANRFGKRELFSLESVLKSHPEGCVVLLSRSLDSKDGKQLLKPLLDRGYRILPVAPDVPLLFNGTPAQAWLEGLENGTIDPGTIAITQNLSNILRLVVLYKYGGIYLDTDMIILKDISGLRNSIGIQSIDEQRKTWKSLNNAVLIFDKEHPLLLKCMQDFTTNFNGSIWGHNGPYMMNRVVMEVINDSNYQFSILSQMAFYPVQWSKVGEIFKQPMGEDMIKKTEEKLHQFERQCYGIHLWNKMSRNLKIEQGSIIGKLISDHCVLCKDVYHVANA